MSKKKVTILDELDIKGSGLYCILPYEKLDKNKKAVFKVGYALNLRKRMEQYHTSYPQGFYFVAILEKPPIPKTRSNKNGDTPARIQLRKIENYIFDEIEELGGRRIYSTTRVNNPNELLEGATEWFYTDEETIHTAFEKAHKKYKGTLDIYSLDEINKQAKKNENKKPNYIAEIVYKI